MATQIVEIATPIQAPPAAVFLTDHIIPTQTHLNIIEAVKANT